MRRVRWVIRGGKNLRGSTEPIHLERDTVPSAVNIIVAVKFDEKSSGRLMTSLIAAQSHTR